MKTMTALIFAGVAGAATYELQNTILAPQAQAAGFQVPVGPDWRQQMIAADRGGEGVDHSVTRYVRTLGLTADQERQIRPLVQQRHDRIRALLMNGPPTLTLDGFMTERQRISADMHDRVDAVLNDQQLQLEVQMHMRPDA
jgi:hypothetical protein